MINKSSHHFFKMPENVNYSAYMAIKENFDMLARLGYCKIVMKDVSPIKRKLHNCYRILVWFFILLYNLQHVIRIIQVGNVIENRVDILTQVKYNLCTLLPKSCITVLSDRMFEMCVGQFLLWNTSLFRRQAKK